MMMEREQGSSWEQSPPPPPPPPFLSHEQTNAKPSPSLPLNPKAEVFEEIPTMDFPFHGMPTVPPRKDMSHMVRWRERREER